MHAIQHATHAAYLDPITGEGLLVLPCPADDLTIGSPSLHESGWQHMLHTLDALRWTLTEGESGDLCHVGTTGDGRAVVGLFGLDPITTDASLTECADALAQLLDAAGVSAPSH